MAKDGHDLISPSEAARMLGISADTVRSWSDDGRLPCLKTSAGHRLFNRRDVERLARERKAAK